MKRIKDFLQNIVSGTRDVCTISNTESIMQELHTRVEHLHNMVEMLRRDNLVIKTKLAHLLNTDSTQ